MDLKPPVFVLLIFYISFVNGQGLSPPDRLQVKMSDEEVIVHWKPPTDAPPNSEYNVQMARYYDSWAEESKVESCTNITRTYCDISSLITTDYRAVYKVRVQLVAGDKMSKWTSQKFSLTDTKLQPPSFTLVATSSTLSVSVHEKPVLKEIFSFGVEYTIFLEKTGQDNKTTTAYLNDDTQDGERVKTFESLKWGQEYCVSIKIQGMGGVKPSNTSHKKCLLLPEQEWYIIATSSLSILSTLSVIILIVAILLCYLKRPEKTPGALKSPASGWLPFSVGEDTVEVVTDKGWFLSRYKTEVKDLAAHITVTEDKEEEERRTSTDSGISMESKSAKTSRGSPPMKQEDSGCGSLGGFQCSTSGQTEYPTEEEGTHADGAKKREDSGVGMGSQLDSCSLILEGQDSGHLNESIPEGNYHRQSPFVHIQVCDEEAEFTQALQDAVLADVVTGYRAGPQTCICSGLGQCTWCHNQGQYGSQVIKQYRQFVDSGVVYSSCSKTQMEEDRTFIQLPEDFPLLMALAPVHLEEEGQDFNMNNVSLSLCDA